MYATRQCLKMLIGLEGAHVFYVGNFGRVQHLRKFASVPITDMCASPSAIRQHSRLLPKDDDLLQGRLSTHKCDKKFMMRELVLNPRSVMSIA
jgi:hypothetical protein